jgi:hypothetical protein
VITYVPVSAVLDQTRYHFRNDNGSESGATSATGGSENTALSGFSAGSSTRIRIQVANTGGASTTANFRFE